MKYRLYIEGKRTKVSGEYSEKKLPWLKEDHIPQFGLDQGQRVRGVFLAAWIHCEDGWTELHELVREED